MDVQRVSDELEISALLTKYARSVDTKDWELYRSLFIDDAHIDYTAAGFIAGARDDATDFLSRQQPDVAMSVHYVMNVESDIDGEIAHTQAMWLNALRLLDASANSFFGGRWHDELVRTADGWRIRNLKLEVLW